MSNMFPEKCERCGGSLVNADGNKECITSMFNKERICMRCKERERAHPKYREALETERAQVMMGNREYDGIGCPPELYEKEGE